MRPILLSVVLTASLLLCGCGTFVDFAPINEPPHPLTRRTANSVEVFSSAAPSRPHVDVGIVEVEQTHGLNEQGTGLMVERMREEAGALGCDAIVLGAATDHQGAQAGSGWAILDPGSTKRQATCIVYDDPPLVQSFKKPQQPDAVPALTAQMVRQCEDYEEPSQH